MMRFIYISLAFIFMASCKGPGKIAGSKEELPVQEPKPTWIDNRPISQTYYIGIGSSSKLSEPLEFSNVAKNNALNDLASEISVTIKGESFLNTLEVNRNFQEEFMSQVSAQTDEYVEGFDVMGTWQDKNEYWVYYRLSKAKHAEIKARIKNEVLSSAYDSYMRGKEMIAEKDASAAIQNFLTGLQSMEPYWNEPNPFTIESGEEIYLDNELYNSLTRLVNRIEINIPANEILLSAQNDYMETVGIQTMYDGLEIGQIPLIYNYDEGKYTRNKAINSNDLGLVSVNVQNVEIPSDGNELMVAVNLEKMIGPFSNDRLMKGVTDKLVQKVVYVPIEIVMPKFFVESYETNLGEELGSAHLRNSLKNELTDKGMSLAGNVNSADYLIQIKSSTNQGGTSQGFHVSYLEFELEIIHRVTGDVVYQTSKNQIKGLQLNFEAAGMEAYKKGGKLIEKEITKDIINSIL